MPGNADKIIWSHLRIVNNNILSNDRQGNSTVKTYRNSESPKMNPWKLPKILHKTRVQANQYQDRWVLRVSDPHFLSFWARNELNWFSNFQVDVWRLRKLLRNNLWLKNPYPVKVLLKSFRFKPLWWVWSNEYFYWLFQTNRERKGIQNYSSSFPQFPTNSPTLRWPINILSN